MATVATSPDEEPDDREKVIRDIIARLSAIEARLGQIPTPSELGHELPISRVEVDKYLKIQRDGINLTIQVDADQLKRDLATGGLGGGGPGVVFAGYLRIDGFTPTGVVDARGNDVQWSYAGTQVQKSGAAYGALAWVATANGFAGVARNMCENSNTGIGVQNNGIDFDAADFPTGFEMIPIPIGDITPFYYLANADGSIEVWFDRCNSVDGLCSGSMP